MSILDQIAQEVTAVQSQLQEVNSQVVTLTADKAQMQQTIDGLNNQVTVLKNTPPTIKTVNIDLTPNQIKAQRIIGVALTHNDMRTPYLFGAEYENNKKFDCSSFTQYCYRVGAGIKIPRNKQYTYPGIEVKFEEMQPGDLLFYDFPEGGTRDGVTDHVAMYIGDGKIIQTNTPATGINIQDVTWNKGSLVKIYRILI